MKTAVEWLVNELRNGKEFNDELIDKAKEMEKQHIIYAHVAGHNAPSSTIKNWDAEQYYNETFNQEEQ